MSILVVAAHPDDEVLGCGGTLARLTDQGVPIRVLILSDGESSRWPSPDAVPDEVVARRRGAAKDACATLGVSDVKMLGFPDNRFDTVPLLEIVRAVEGEVSDLRPDTVFTHHAGDMNVDHRLAAQAVLTATRPVPGSPVRRVYAFEVLSSSHVAAPNFGPPFLPNSFVDIASTLERKLSAMTRYKGELQSFPHPRSLEAIKALAQLRGTVCGLPAAEAFVLVREIQDDPR